ncbi:hypothetical protein LSH36_223g01062 [Paralvinella palmiformis]|uniref:cAMP-regulated phosphoprotein 19 n=1 Tax=Paralvinella palmiformis TaxID=53620 RepID=A0AAD9N3R1_9ANNE|nr:hypothetical protein LSH36_223g01062 [Paralvinella palmiformis]
MSNMSEEQITRTQEETKENVNDQNPQEPAKTKTDLENDEEAKLRAKYPGLKGPGSNAFLQKRLSRGQKYFDSGDYNMAKAKMGGGAASKPVVPTQKLILQTSTGEAIPTPEAIPHKKTHLTKSKLLSPSNLS